MKVLTLLAVLLLGAASPMPMQQQEHCMQNGMMGSGMMMQGMHGAADHAYMQSMMSMHHGMQEDAYNGNPDHDFMVMMIPHHRAAIDMARAELKYGKDAKLRAMATQIIKTQQAEIDQMSAMLR